MIPVVEQGLPRSGVEKTAQASADRLALALEDAGFDVGRAFPTLRGGLDPDGAAVVELGRVTVAVADDLSSVLARAAEQGIIAPTD